MNLIEQLRLTPKWGEFKQWWNKNYAVTIFLNDEFEDGFWLNFKLWCDFPFEMQESVFKKFIEQDKSFEIVAVIDNDIWCVKYIDTNGNGTGVKFNTFEELILWYFNN